MTTNKEQLRNVVKQLDTVDLNGLRPPQARHRGLPDRKSLEALARTYLEDQRKLWPGLAGGPLLPEPTDAQIAKMVDQFEHAYTSGSLPVFKDIGALPNDVAVGAVYSRYSDSNSNPRSLNQQVHNELAGAARDRVFAPWEYVFADAAVTGTTDQRRGYQLLKALIMRESNPIDCIFIDELGRASRDHIESLSLKQRNARP